MDLFRLECFVVLAEELHFGRAAERCHISQPAMSQLIRKLEHELQVQLAFRTKRSVTLTPAGQVFVGECRQLVRQMSKAVTLAQRTQSGEVGHLRLGCTEPALFVIFPELSRHFRAANPGVGIDVREMTTTAAERALRRGDVDAALVHPPLEDTALSCDLIAKPPFALAIPSDHRLVARREVRLTDLADEDFVMFPREIGPEVYDLIIGLCRDAGFGPRIVHYAHPAQSIIAMVAAGMGIGFVAGSAQQLRRHGVEYRRIRGPRPSLAFGLAYRAEDRTPALDAFKESAHFAGQHFPGG